MAWNLRYVAFCRDGSPWPTLSPQQATPIYYDMVDAILAHEKGNTANCLHFLGRVNLNIRDVFQVFYDNLTESRVSQSVWLSHVQGFQAWGVGKVVNDQFIKDDGLSGSHVLFYQALDAFLGLDRYLSDEDMERYIPVNQRRFCVALKRNNLRSKLLDDEALEVFSSIAKKFKVICPSINFSKYF